MSPFKVDVNCWVIVNCIKKKIFGFLQHSTLLASRSFQNFSTFWSGIVEVGKPAPFGTRKAQPDLARTTNSSKFTEPLPSFWLVNVVAAAIVDSSSRQTLSKSFRGQPGVLRACDFPQEIVTIQHHRRRGHSQGRGHQRHEGQQLVANVQWQPLQGCSGFPSDSMLAATCIFRWWIVRISSLRSSMVRSSSTS